MFQGSWFSVVVLQGRGVSSIARILVCQDDIETPFLFFCSAAVLKRLRSNSCLLYHCRRAESTMPLEGVVAEAAFL